MTKKLLPSIMAIGVALILVSCAPTVMNDSESGKGQNSELGSVSESGKRENENIVNRIGLAMHNQTADWAVKFADTFKKMAQQNHYEVVITDANSKAADQVSQIEDLVAQNVAGLVVLPADYTALGQALKIAKDANIKIVNADSMVHEEDQNLVDVFVTADSFQGGYILGEYLAKHLPDKAILGEINYSQLSVIADRFSGVEKALKDGKRDDVQIVSKDATDLNAIASYAEDMLIANPDIKALVCLNDSSALTAFGVAKQLNKTELMVFGFDGSPASKQSISENEMTGTVVYSPVKLAEAALDSVIRLIGGNKVEKDTKVDMELISRENIEKYDINAWN